MTDTPLDLTDVDLAHATDTFTHPCTHCGGRRRVTNGKPRTHWCRWRLLRRRNHRRVTDAYWDGYRFALDNVSDPMVYADIESPGSGWLGLRETGVLVIELRALLDRHAHTTGATP